MSESLCNCHCGTRIDLDEQLLEERQMWKEKYNCLQKQIKVDIEAMKENIYMECAELMQKEFSQKEKQQNKIVNDKNNEIKSLIARVIELQTQIQILKKEKQISEQKYTVLEAQNEARLNELNLIKSKYQKNIHESELQHEQSLISLRKRLNSEANEAIEKLQLEKEHLKHKVKEFELKYSKIIPEVQKIKNALSSKAAEAEQLQCSIEKMAKQHQGKVDQLKRDIEDLTKLNSKYSRHNKQLINEVDDLKQELEKWKKVNKEVRVQAVYVDRPVEVEKVVEKVVEVEKVVKKYVDNPNSEKLKGLEEENRKLVQELNKILAEVKEMEEDYARAVHDLEESIKVHESNQVQYKKQREVLASRIAEQNRQIDMLEQFIERGKSKGGNENERIIVHVKKDGTYQKTVEKLSSQQASKKKR